MSENVYILADSEICRRIGKKIRNLRLRQNITQMSLAEQSQETGEVRSGQVEAPIVEFLGWEGIYAKFKIYFEIYGSDNYHGLCQLVEREL